MRIRNVQLAIFDPTAEDDLVDDVCALFADELPELVEGLPPEVVRQRVKVGFSRARRHGLTDDIPLVTFVTYMFGFAPNFDDHPKFRGILGDEAIDQELRMDVLTQQSTDEDWEAVQSGRDERAWQPAEGAG